MNKIKPKLMLNLSENMTILDPRDVRKQAECAIIAEEAGFDSVSFSEHISLGASSNSRGEPENPREFADFASQSPQFPWPNSIVLMSAAAQATKTIRIISAAIIAPLRHPLLLAKELGTLDLLCEGRLIVVPTVSWHKDEYDALGLDFHKRGKMLDEQLTIMDQVWRESPTSFEGEFYNFTDMSIEPKAWLPSGPKLWIGAMPKLHTPGLKRLVKYGSGVFCGHPMPVEDVERIRVAMADGGRDINDLEFAGGLWAEFPDANSCADVEKALEQVPALLEANINTIGVKPCQFIDDINELPELCKTIVRRVEEIAS